MTWTSGQCLDFVNTKVYEYVHSKNGLRVLLCPVTSSNICGYMRVVNAGSKEEADFSPKGMAHFLEHMSFRINGGKIWSLADQGDVINAMTNMDSTRYYVVHLPEQTAQTIEIDAGRFKIHDVPADKIPVESHAVINELERGQQAGNAMFETTSSIGIMEHPYHSSTIGTKTEVKKATANDMAHFRKTYYVPNNATLIFAGSFDAEKVLADVDKHFGDMLKGDHCNPVHTPEPPQHGKRSAELCIDAPCPMFCMAFRQPKGATKEAMALQCISRLTWSNGLGRAKCLLDDNTLHDIGTYAPRQIDPYLWFIHGTYERTSDTIRLQMEQRLLAVLQSFVTHKVSQDELSSVKSNMKDDWTRNLESVTDMMNELGRGAATGNWKDFADRQATLDQITPEDIQRVASEVFQQHHMTVTHVIPTKHKAQTLSSTPMCVAKTLTSPDASALPKSMAAAKQDWQVQRVSPAANIIHVPKATYIRTTLSARFSPEEHDIATIMTACMGKGAVSPGVSTTEALLALHTERSFSHDHEFIHMSMSLPLTTPELEKASNLMFQKEWLQPSFNSELIELQKRHHIAELNALKKDQGHLTKSAFIQALFERTKYHIPIPVRVDAISKLSVDDVRAFHKKWIQTSRNTYLTMVTPTAEAAGVLGKVFPAHEEMPTTTLAWSAKPREASHKKIDLPGYGSFQIMMGQTIEAEPLTKDGVAMQCAACILGGGMTARLMHTVREQKGLGTYGLYAVVQHVSPQSPSIFCVQGTFGAAYLKEGMACTTQLVKEWAKHGVTPKELEHVKSNVLGSKIISMDTVDNLHSMVLQNILDKRDTKKSFQEFKTIVHDLTLEDVNNAIQKHIDPKKMATVVVGPPST